MLLYGKAEQPALHNFAASDISFFCKHERNSHELIYGIDSYNWFNIISWGFQIYTVEII